MDAINQQIQEQIDPSFHKFVQKEVMNSIYFVAGLFATVKSWCEFVEDEEDCIIRKEFVPSQELIKEEKQGPKGLFARSFEKIPCNEPIKSCQYRTGRRYIQADNFPEDDALDHYLGLMNRASSHMHTLKTSDSLASFCLATSDELEFQQLCREFVELFPQLDGNMIQALVSYYPQQIECLVANQTLTVEFVQEFFTFPDGKEDFETLEEMFFYVRTLVKDGQHLAKENPEISPKDYQDFMVESQFSALPPLETPTVYVTDCKF